MGGFSVTSRQPSPQAEPEVLTRTDVARLLAEQQNLREQLAQLTERDRG